MSIQSNYSIVELKAVVDCLVDLTEETGRSYDQEIEHLNKIIENKEKTFKNLLT